MSKRRRRGRGRRRPNSQERILGRDGTTSGPEAAVVAELRYLVGRVERRHGALPSVVGVVSAIADEGVTFTTHALAAVLSTDFERSVCVVSLDWGSAGQASIHDLLAPWSEAARSLRGDDPEADDEPQDDPDASEDEPLEAAGALPAPGPQERADEPAPAGGRASTNGAAPAEPDDLASLVEPWDDDDEVVTRPRRRARAGAPAAAATAADEDDEVWTGAALDDDGAEDDTAGTTRAAEDADVPTPDGEDDGEPAGDGAGALAPAAGGDLEAADAEEPGTLPVLSEHQEVDLTWGIADVVRGAVSVDEVLVDTGRPRLWAVPSGVVLVDERPRMANHEGLREVVADLGRRFDHVLLDLPPVLDASESLPLAGLADACVLVVAQGSTAVRDVQDAQTELTGIRLLGAVLNRSRTKTPNAIMRRFVGSD